MNQYLDLLQQVRQHGTWQENRTGVRTQMVPGATLKFDLQRGFPILTTKKINFTAVAAELCGFINGVDSAAKFREFGTKIWDANANENRQWLENANRKGTDDLGRIYGVQWRHWNQPPDINHPMGRGNGFDQLAAILNTIQSNPESRRMVCSAWKPDEIYEMALPPCHLLWQVLIQQSNNRMHMTMYQRSCDLFLGVPFNITSYALLLKLIARATGYVPGTLTMFLADVHIYENHLDQVKEQLRREPKKLPQLLLPLRDEGMLPLQWLEGLRPNDFELEGYDYHPAIAAPMAV